MIKRKKLAAIFSLTSVLVQENMYDSEFQHVSTKRVLSFFSPIFQHTTYKLLNMNSQIILWFMGAKRSFSKRFRFAPHLQWSVLWNRCRAVLRRPGVGGDRGSSSWWCLFVGRRFKPINIPKPSVWGVKFQPTSLFSNLLVVKGLKISDPWKKFRYPKENKSC